MLAIPESLRYNNKRKENVFSDGGGGGDEKDRRFSNLLGKSCRCTREKKEGGHDLGPMLERTVAHIPQKDRKQGGGHHKQGYVQIV